jgi:folate-binding protein YgfZ
VLQRLPLHDAHVAAGAKLEVLDGWEQPLAYGDAASEYDLVRRGVGLIDRGAHGAIEVTGRDRATFLHALLSNDIKALTPGQGCAATLLDVHGKVQVLLLVWVLADRILLVTPPGTSTSTLEALDHYLFAEKVELRDATAELTFLLLAGPGAPDLAARMTGIRPADAAWSSIGATLAGVPIELVRGGGETGEPEIWAAVPVGSAQRVWEAVMAAGARAVGFTALESLRIETGTPRFPQDVDGTVLLPEIPLESLVSFSKGCYPGQEVVVRIRDRGHVNRHLRGLLVTGEAVPVRGAEVRSGEVTLGRVTSAAWGFGLNRPVALGFVRRTHAEPGTPVTIVSEGAELTATVSGLPFPP